MRKAILLASAVLLLAAPLAYGQPIQTTACEIQQGTIPVNTEVFIDSLVITAVDNKPSTFGMWAEHPQPCSGYPNRAYSAIEIYMDHARLDTIGGIGVEIGDLISVRGSYQEYPAGGVPSRTEIDAPADSYAPRVTIIKEGFGVPDPVRLTVHDLGTAPEDSATCEKWECVYIRVDTLVCTEWYEPLEFAEWVVVELEDFTGFKTTDTLVVDDKLVDPSLAKPDVGDTLKTIRGIFAFAAGSYKLWPQSNDDVEYLSAPPAPNVLQTYSRNNSQLVVVFDKDVDPVSGENTDNYSLETVNVTSAARWTTDNRKVTVTHSAPILGTAELLTVCNVENMFGRAMPQCQQLGFRIGIMPVSFVQTPGAAGDTSQVVGEQVTITGICTGGTDTFPDGFYVGTPGGGPYSGIWVYYHGQPVERGDSVHVSGVVDEYYDLTEMDEPQYVNSALFPPSGSVPGDVINVSDLAVHGPDSTAEQWEGVLVQLQSVQVVTEPDTAGQWNVRSGTDSVSIGSGNYSYSAEVGDSVHVKGIVHYTFDEWLVRPRDDDDIVVFHVSGVEDETMALHFRELTNYPNPFNPKTVVEFGLAHTSPVKLTVYDVSGRVVRTLVDKEMATGTYQVLWNGNDSNGHPVAAGVYYCRLEAGDRMEMTKLVLVN